MMRNYTIFPIFFSWINFWQQPWTRRRSLCFSSSAQKRFTEAQRPWKGFLRISAFWKQRYIHYCWIKIIYNQQRHISLLYLFLKVTKCLFLSHISLLAKDAHLDQKGTHHNNSAWSGRRKQAKHVWFKWWRKTHKISVISLLMTKLLVPKESLNSDVSYKPEMAVLGSLISGMVLCKCQELLQSNLCFKHTGKF